MNTSLTNNNYFFDPSQLRQQAKSSRMQSIKDDASWFQAPPFRKRVYERLHFETRISSPVKTKIVEQTVNNIWRICTETAPIVLTQIAHEESYKGKEDAILAISIESPHPKWYSHTLEQYSDVQKGIDLFKKILCTPLEKDYGMAIICNLYCGTHAFIIEKRSNESCFIYQSYKDENKGYTFDEFLEDTRKHIQWKPEKIVKVLSKFISKEEPIDTRLKKYKKMFFMELTEDSLKLKDSLYELPFVFVATSHYPLTTKMD